MIYLVSNQNTLFKSDIFEQMSLEESLKEISSWEVVQFDTETNGKDPHICNLLCAQFGNALRNKQIVVDCSTIDILNYKEILETKLIVGHNLKFDISFLYNYEIIPTKVWDTMIVEQLLYLGYDSKYFHYSLKAVAERYLNISIDKSIRGEIIWRGLDESVIKYAACDVMYLEDIMRYQKEQCEKKECLAGAELENKFVPVIAYLEWCGIKLDVDKWLVKIRSNEDKKQARQQQLNAWVINKAKTAKQFSKYIRIELQGDLFLGFQTEPECIINWDSPAQVIPFMKDLGFDTTTEDKQTGQKKDSVVEKVLKKQKGIADDLLKLYFEYKESGKDCSTYGYNYINSINPKTGRIHTTFWQLGAASGRMSCGSTKPNLDLARYKNIPSTGCVYPQIQNLPADDEVNGIKHYTRTCFIADKDNLLISADYSALESRLGADIYNEPEMLEEFLYRSGDMHSLCASIVFKDELEGIPIEKIKEVRPDLRKKVKPIEFSQQFGIRTFYQ
jgi:DNA polymerase-1